MPADATRNREPSEKYPRVLQFGENSWKPIVSGFTFPPSFFYFFLALNPFWRKILSGKVADTVRIQLVPGIPVPRCALSISTRLDPPGFVTFAVPRPTIMSTDAFPKHSNGFHSSTDCHYAMEVFYNVQQTWSTPGRTVEEVFRWCFACDPSVT